VQFRRVISAVADLEIWAAERSPRKIERHKQEKSYQEDRPPGEAIDILDVQGPHLPIRPPSADPSEPSQPGTAGLCAFEHSATVPD